MREIKFRAWDKIDGKWQRLNRVVFFGRGGADGVSIVPPENVVLQQFTGLRDKNGKEVYEGDVLKDRLGKTRAVRWNDEGYWDPLTSGDSCGCCSDTITPEYAEIIGNIYENPELMEGEK